MTHLHLCTAYVIFKNVPQYETQAVHTKGISKIVTSQQIIKVINPLPNYILIMSISKDVPHSMTPKLFTPWD